MGSGKLEGYPSGSVVEYAIDEQGYLIFAFSSMSPHTTDVRRIGKASLTIPSPNFKVASLRVRLKHTSLQTANIHRGSLE